jgi:hypothetical protein
LPLFEAWEEFINTEEEEDSDEEENEIIAQNT